MEFQLCPKDLEEGAHQLLNEFSRSFQDAAVGFSFGGRIQVYVLKQDQSILGVVEIRKHADFISLSRMMVHAHYRGSGIGEELLKHCLLVCGNSHVKALMPEVYGDLFRRHGFSVIGELSFMNGMRFLLFEKQASRDQQANLGEQLQGFSRVQDVEQETSMRLRKLRTRGSSGMREDFV